MAVQIRREELVNPALIQKIKRLEIEMEKKEQENARLRERIRLQDKRLREYRGRDMQKYDRRRNRREERKEIATEWLVGGGVAGVVLAASVVVQKVCLLRWGLMP